jgi:UDP-N-acetylmuramate: L-alanyl-gamma-D-glutamyl-meso-diaminopimelate ligase
MHVHFIGVAGTGMGSLAGLLQSAGHEVSGSDVAFYPPMGPALKRWGITLHEGFRPENLNPVPDLVVVGNVCRRDNPEARAAIDGRMKYLHMCDALGELVLKNTAPLVVAGTHGKTTTSAMCAWLLDQAGLEPGFLIGGVPKNFDRGWQLPRGGKSKRGLPLLHRDPSQSTSGAPASRQTPFVVEGDEYDTAFFEKTPKCWHYRPQIAIVTSIEHDHIDIYPDETAYHAAFAGFVERVPADGLIVAYAGDPAVSEIVTAHAAARVSWYALDNDEHFAGPVHWLGAPATTGADGQLFDLFAGGVASGRVSLPMSGAHNARNALAALAAVCEGYGVRLDAAVSALARFEGVARRQELIAEVRGISIYDDFAHHPTAVRETLAGLRRRHDSGRLWAVYEPRTATACRKLHQDAYAEAFSSADQVIIAPLGRSNIPEDERLDLDSLVTHIADAGVAVEAAESIDAIIERLVRDAEPGDTIALLSNGAFGGIHQRLALALE